MSTKRLSLSKLINKNKFKVAFLDKTDIITSSEPYLCLITTPISGQILPQLRLEVYHNQILNKGDFIYLFERKNIADLLNKFNSPSLFNGLSVIYIPTQEKTKIIWAPSFVTVLGGDNDTFAPIIKLGPPAPLPQVYNDFNISVDHVNLSVEKYSTY
ncbi:MAG: hypothetical protein LCH91_20140 [Bacteroidetes bacterium]|nr:hypothetical protein [Bacteroidota bacterium]